MSQQSRQQDVHFQIMWNRLIAVLEEQATTLIRTAFSTSVREAGDLSAGVFDREGRMIAQAVTGTPGHVNTMAAAVPHFINDIGPERIYPGDVYLTNDPWKGTGHLHDITVVTPVFRSALPAEIRGDQHGRTQSSSGLPPDIRGNAHGRSASLHSPNEPRSAPLTESAQGERSSRSDHADGLGISTGSVEGNAEISTGSVEEETVPDVLIGFFASTAHVVDIGGRGYGPDGTEVYEEGLRIPIMKWAERGELNHDLVNIIANNVREQDQVLGDIHGLAASNETGRRRLLEMLDEFDMTDLGELSEFIFERTHAATMAALEPVAKGVYRNEMRVDGYEEHVDLVVELTVTDDGMHADFAGTSPLSQFGINVPIVYAQAYFTYGMLVSLAPELPNNYASLAPFTVSAPDGVILNAQEPDPVSVRHVLGHFVTDLCLGAISQALPDIVPAEGAGALWNFQASARSADPAALLPPMEILMFNSGGTGARPTLDGLTATAFPSGVMTMSAEATEQVGPIILWRKEIREGSGGAGKYRGGLGQIIEISPTDGYHFEFSAMFDRVENPARGRFGGEDGAPGKVYLDDGTPFSAKGKQLVAADRRLILELPGGGGYGDPDDRDPDASANDETQGYVS